MQKIYNRRRQPVSIRTTDRRCVSVARPVLPPTGGGEPLRLGVEARDPGSQSGHQGVLLLERRVHLLLGGGERDRPPRLQRLQPRLQAHHQGGALLLRGQPARCSDSHTKDHSCAHIFDMQKIMCIIQELCVA